ncbi:glycoside hydrolase [Thalassobellus sediminis]|uniref:glycoside hydrolase n=1 Tax=Thalassobellus sediminis TaxID=3367753 RepID=UPI0037B29E5C
MKIFLINKVRLIFLLALILLSFVNCEKKTKKTSVLKLELDVNKTFQTIKNFGASDAWSTQFLGKNWPKEDKNKIAKLLFSKSKKKDGSPEGIGLTAWRFNIGAGSAEQENESQIKDEWRRTESFLTKNGSYDWNKQSGQLWFLKAAKNYGVNTFIGFVNSPPVLYTKNEKAWSNNGFSSNLKKGYYKKYADFLSEVVKGVANKTGVTFNYVSPFNEPQWEWKCCKQEGTPWNNNEIFSAVKEIDNSFKNNNISSKIEVTEAGQINALYTETENPKRSNQISYFFDKNSEGFLGNIKSVSQKIAGHSYFSTWDLNNSIKTRTLLNNKIKDINPELEYWMTEYCILENNKLIKGNGRDLGIDSALYTARVIHSDLVYANASAWHWWLAISPYKYKDGLIYIDKDKFGGNYYESKMLWALGHYSRFIKPEMKRISISRLDNKSATKTIKGVLQSAYMSNNEIVIVFVNQLNKTQKIKLSGIPKEYKIMKAYQTTKEKDFNLKKIEDLNLNEVFNLPENSLMTCVLKK